MVITELQTTPKILLELTPEEAGALDAICGYGAKAFLEVFEEKLGKHYMAPFRGAVDSLFKKGHGLLHDVKNYEKFKKELIEVSKKHGITLVKS